MLGSALHFTYELSGNNPVVGVISAVNESVWEHLKLVFWPSLFWILITVIHLRRKVGNFLPAKTIGIYIMVLFIPAVFYTYTAFTSKSIFVIDIASFIAAVIVGQTVSYKLYKYRFPKATEIVAIAAIILLATIFIVFTFYPPQLPIFQDPLTGYYGIN